MPSIRQESMRSWSEQAEVQRRSWRHLQRPLETGRRAHGPCGRFVSHLTFVRLDQQACVPGKPVGAITSTTRELPRRPCAAWHVVPDCSFVLAQQACVPASPPGASTSTSRERPRRPFAACRVAAHYHSGSKSASMCSGRRKWGRDKWGHTFLNFRGAPCRHYGHNIAAIRLPTPP
jgi:hypothetical protein